MDNPDVVSFFPSGISLSYQQQDEILSYECYLATSIYREMLCKQSKCDTGYKLLRHFCEYLSLLHVSITPRRTIFPQNQVVSWYDDAYHHVYYKLWLAVINRIKIKSQNLLINTVCTLLFIPCKRMHLFATGVISYRSTQFRIALNCLFTTSQ